VKYIKGGSWGCDIEWTRSALRDADPPDDDFYEYGSFRLLVKRRTKMKIIKGGSWNVSASGTRSADHINYPSLPGFTLNCLNFRLLAKRRTK